MTNMSFATYTDDPGVSPEQPAFPPSRRARLFSPLRRKSQVPWLLAIPGLAVLFVFQYAAFSVGMLSAFTDWDGLTQSRWVGLDNFREIVSDPLQRTALLNTLLLASCYVVLVCVIGLALAIGLNASLKSRNVLRAIFFAPWIVSPLAVSYIWSFVFDPQGALNIILMEVGLDSWTRPWLADPELALWLILVVLIWQHCGLTMIIYLAGLQGISDDVYEATFVDGAGAWLRFRRITLPLLAPSTTIAGTLSLIYGLRVFDQVMALTNGGPVDATETLSTQVFKQTFAYGRFGYGAALALILTILVLVVGLLQLTILRKRERAL